MPIKTVSLCMILYLVSLFPAFPCFASAAQTQGGKTATILESASFDVVFPPEGDGLSLILRAITSAQKSIHVAAYRFTNESIAEALLTAHKRGVAVRIVVDEESAGRSNARATLLASQGVPVHLFGKYRHHNKFMVIDGQHVQTGSANYNTGGQERNAENVLVLWNAPELATMYIQEWERLWSEGKEVK